MRRAALALGALALLLTAHRAGGQSAEAGACPEEVECRKECRKSDHANCGSCSLECADDALRCSVGARIGE